MNNVYQEKTMGVLGVQKDERSMRDQKLQNEFSGCSNSKEKYDTAGITEIPAEYKNGWEQRSVKDKMMLVEFNRCNKEKYNGMDSCQYAKFKKI
jgi:hypothetical protein